MYLACVYVFSDIKKVCDTVWRVWRVWRALGQCILRIGVVYFIDMVESVFPLDQGMLPRVVLCPLHQL